MFKLSIIYYTKLLPSAASATMLGNFSHHQVAAGTKGAAPMAMARLGNNNTNNICCRIGKHLNNVSSQWDIINFAHGQFAHKLGRPTKSDSPNPTCMQRNALVGKVKAAQVKGCRRAMVAGEFGSHLGTAPLISVTFVVSNALISSPHSSWWCVVVQLSLLRPLPSVLPSWLPRSLVPAAWTC